MDVKYNGYILRCDALPFDLPILINGVLQEIVRQGYRPSLVIAKDYGRAVNEKIFHPDGVFPTPGEAQQEAERYGRAIIDESEKRENLQGL